MLLPLPASNVVTLTLLSDPRIGVLLLSSVRASGLEKMLECVVRVLLKAAAPQFQEPS